MLDGLAVIVTGAGQGLGRAYAIHAAGHGAGVVVNDIDRALAQRVVDEIVAGGGTAVAAGGSVADWDGAAAMAELATTTFGRLDGLVNNAGLFHLARPEDEDEAQVRQMIDANVVGPLFCGIHAIRKMIEGGNGGSIINVSSGYQSGVPAGGCYGATKGAVASLTYSWALDLHVHGIRVNAIAPLARTRQTDYAVERLRATGERSAAPGAYPPEAIAPLVTLLLSPATKGITGQMIRFDGRLLAIVAHPGALEGVVECDDWSLELMDEALSTTLKGSLRPVGLDPVRLSE
jgi:NAD(P)-dependent dehydrogenase (short-subunit alcohol dehydrogenase family)